MPGTDVAPTRRQIVSARPCTASFTPQSARRQLVTFRERSGAALHSTGSDKQGISLKRCTGWVGCPAIRTRRSTCRVSYPLGTHPWRERPRLRSTAAALTSLTALAATGLVAGPAVGQTSAVPCALQRTPAHHSEGLDTWNGAYQRPHRTLDAVMVFLSFPDSPPQVSPGELAADYFPRHQPVLRQGLLRQVHPAPAPAARVGRDAGRLHLVRHTA